MTAGIVDFVQNNMRIRWHYFFEWNISDNFCDNFISVRSEPFSSTGNATGWSGDGINANGLSWNTSIFSSNGVIKAIGIKIAL